mmetsp:Transcript_167148/g.536865  ORF Transcript_167148/g.536865 Transcript_167148/m.536865 type:complete len:1088 (+) Transcript_167148:101-3364(+)|eukprot:CAMPEP_0203954488 /NCGR_PEP_ID=MMETSP0359-20131031/87491_1 /ASSEMBLY_ACC=CAM_ASM_000338 /TAXON_ID=268821 /ORGANISM="Scrippsiella Hangoei, Strain SHTV-5" /LENGTH=1087 /DNA_ID=CAMNT_0050888017 /DNA_START=99 /DNA_END=3362 /DNA_ORIENTATION=-
MFLAKYLDQKQGEARVVDKGSKVRAHLEHWLAERPSAARVAELGILGRGQRVELARGVLDQFMQHRIQAQEAELARIPAGNFQYSDRLRQLLDGTGSGPTARQAPATESCDTEALEALLSHIRAEHEGLEHRLQEAEAAWAAAAETCRLAAEGPEFPSAVAGVSRAVSLLDNHRTTAGASLKGVFEELQGFQRLTAKKQCLESIVAVAEKTERVREAVFACRGAEALPLATLEEIPELCCGLPQRSRALGARRLRFVVGPLRTMLAQELRDVLRETGQWPQTTGQLTSACKDAAAASSIADRVASLCADLQRVQSVEARIPTHPDTDSTAPLDSPPWAKIDSDEGLWACCALSTPLVARFRQLFCRPESDLCRMDKPEWAFKYLLDNVFNDHAQLLETWVSPSADGAGVAPSSASASGRLSLGSARCSVLERVDLVAGLACALAKEARLFVRSRMPSLAKPEEKAALLHTLHHLVRFHADIAAAGGATAGAAAFADFDTNRPLVPPKPKPKPKAKPKMPIDNDVPALPEPGASGSDDGDFADDRHEVVLDRGGDTRGSALMAGLAHLKKGDAATAPAAAAPPLDRGTLGGTLGGRLFAGLSQLSGGGGSADPFAHLRKPEASAAAAAAAASASSGSPARSPRESRSPERSGGGARGGGGGGGGLVGARLARLAASSANRLASSAAAGMVASSPVADVLAAESSDEEETTGFLDVWAYADADFVCGRLSAATASKVWQTKPLRLGGASGGEAKVAEIASLVADLFEVSRGRSQCLPSKTARATYCTRVLETGLQQVIAGVKARWNAISDILSEECSEAAVLSETMEEICRFLDGFPLAEHFSLEVDSANALRLNILAKLAEGLSDLVAKYLRRLESEACVFSFTIAPPLVALSRRLRPSSFRAVAQQAVAKLASLLTQHLRRQGFPAESAASLFAGNCDADLRGALSAATAVLGESGLSPLQPLWDGCALLALPSAEAEALLATLRHAERCSLSYGDSMLTEPREALVAAGVRELSAKEALEVLSKRSSLVGASPQDMFGTARYIQSLHTDYAGLLPDAKAMLGGLDYASLQQEAKSKLGLGFMSGRF